MKSHAWSCLAVVGLLVPAAIRGDDDPAKADRDKFQGIWNVASFVQLGTDVPPEQLAAQRMIFKDDKYIQKIGPRVVEEGTVVIDPDKKPKAIELKITGGADKGKSQLGIYQLDGDSIKVCFGLPGAKERPKEFVSDADSETLLVVFKREKTEDKDKEKDKD